MLNILDSEFFFNIVFMSSNWIYWTHCICLKTLEQKLKDVKLEFKCIVHVKCPKKRALTGSCQWLVRDWWQLEQGAQAGYGKWSAVPATLAQQAAVGGVVRWRVRSDPAEWSVQLWLKLGLLLWFWLMLSASKNFPMVHLGAVWKIRGGYVENQVV